MDSVLVNALAAVLLASSVLGQATLRVSVSSAGVEANGASSYAALSPDGTLVAFSSLASNLVGGDTNASNDWFVRDLVAGTTSRISLGAGGAQATGDAGADSAPAFSADGRFVVFSSQATNLVAGDSNGVRDVFLRDRLLNTTTRVSVSSAGVEGNGVSTRPALSADGRYVSFQSYATNLVSGDTNGWADIFVKDRITGTLERVSVASGGAQADNGSWFSTISGDGRYVAFASLADNLVGGDTNANWDVFLRDRQAGTTTRIGVSSSGAQANNYNTVDGNAGFSTDGRWVAFSSFATNLDPSDTNGKADIFLRDRSFNTTALVSLTSTGGLADDHCYNSSISAGGRFVVFDSFSSNIVPGDTGMGFDVFVRDVLAGTTTRASVDGAGSESDGSSRLATVSADGRTVAFESNATNLVAGDTNAVKDIFVRVLWGGAPGGGDGTADFGDAPDGIASCQGTPNCNPVALYPTLRNTTNAPPGRTAPFHTGEDPRSDYWLGNAPDHEADAFQPCCDWISALHGGAPMDLDDGPLLLCLDPGCLSGVVVGMLNGQLAAAGCFGPTPPNPTIAFWIYRVGMGENATPFEPRFINIDVDVDLSGHYGDAGLEWATQDQPFPYIPGGQQVMLSGLFPVLTVFVCGGPGGWCIGPFWTRFHVGPEQMLGTFPNGDWDGSGANGGYPRGETEDWVVYCDPQSCSSGGGCSAWGDCNNNGRPDVADIALGFSADLDGNSIPDECGGTFYNENEPNSTKTQATPVTLIDGDRLVGFSNGGSTGTNDSSPGSADYFLVQTAPLPYGIYRHRLMLENASGHTGTIRGLAVGGNPPQITGTEVELQSSTPGSAPAAFDQWYGFGRSERVYYRVTGTQATGSYSAVLETDRVVPRVLPEPFHAGPITISTVGQGHATDTEIFVFDSTLHAIPGFRNDDAASGIFQSTLTRNFAAGTYYVAIGRFNTCDDMLTGSDDGFTTGSVLDFPDALLSSQSSATPVDVSFAISDSQHSQTVAAQLAGQPAYDVAWYRIQVSGNSSPLVSFCDPGTGGVIPCPCSNPPVGSGRGCNNSSGTGGAALSATGSASLANDTLVFTTAGEKPTATSIVMQGTASIGSGAAFGQGVRCVGGTLKRLYVKAASGGSITAPQPGDPSVSSRSAALGDPLAAGQTRTYMVYYRDPIVLGGCSASSTFNGTQSGSVAWSQ